MTINKINDNTIVKARQWVINHYIYDNLVGKKV